MSTHCAKINRFIILRLSLNLNSDCCSPPERKVEALNKARRDFHFTTNRHFDSTGDWGGLNSRATGAMDTHLTTLGATLDAIARLHESVPSSSKNVYRPFTCAVLNTYKLDVLDYIRDADQVESNLFWYPPQAGGGGVGAAKTEGGEEKKEGEAVATPVGVSARLPEPREYVPPTPLRKTAMEAEAKGLVRFNARTLLKAAQKLLDN